MKVSVALPNAPACVTRIDHAAQFIKPLAHQPPECHLVNPKSARRAALHLRHVLAQ